MSGSPDQLVVVAAAWVAVGTSCWLCGGIAVAIVSRRRGAVGSVCRRLLHRYPAWAQRWAVAMAGVVVATVNVSVPAYADSGRPTPGLAPLGWPTPATAPPTTAPTPGRPPAHPTVVVRAGQCLWQIAAHDLGPPARPAAIAAAWPRWWVTNRDVIGPDPDLLRPGERLRRPRPTERSTS